MKGGLPWQGATGDDMSDKNEMIMDIKSETPVQSLCKKLPIEMSQYMFYCRNLKFEDCPDYVYLLGLFNNYFQKYCTKKKFEFDWDIMKKTEILKKEKTEETNCTNTEEKKEKMPEVKQENIKEEQKKQLKIIQSRLSSIRLIIPQCGQEETKKKEEEEKKDIKPEEKKGSNNSHDSCDFQIDETNENQSILGKQN